MPDGVPPGRLKALQMSGLVDSVRNGTATANGFVDETVRAVRILAATEQMLAKLGPAGVAECRDLDLSGRTNGVLAAVCQVELDRLPTTLEDDIRRLSEAGKVTGRERLALEFRINKKKMLKQLGENLAAISAPI